jgi:flagellin FlaB
MSNIVTRFNKNEKGQAALETAIILIAFVVVASVFAFTILSSGSNSTEKGKQAISAGLESVQSSMAIKGSVIGAGASNKLTTVTFTVSLVAGGSPVDLTSGSGSNAVVISYRDATKVDNDLAWTATFVGAHNAGNLLEAGEMAEITVTLVTTPGPNTPFTLEVKPPSGAVLNISRTTPAAINTVNELN